MKRRHFQYRETIATLLANEEKYITAGIEGMLGARHEIERCIAHDPFFAITYEPYCPSCDGTTVSRMVSAADEAGVGPMAAVAGAIAESVGKKLLPFSDEVIVENGGDIFLKTSRERTVGVYAGESTFTGSKRRAVGCRWGYSPGCGITGLTD